MVLDSVIITISGTPGSGKSTIAKMLAARLGYAHLSAGDFMREMAKERGRTLTQLANDALTDQSIDDEIDQRTLDYAKAHDNFVIDSRLGWHFIPKAGKSPLKVLLTVKEEVAAQRIYSDQRPEERENTSLEATLRNTRERLAAETARYRERYGIDYTEPKNHDLVINATKLTPEQVVERILPYVERRDKEFK